MFDSDFEKELQDHVEGHSNKKMDYQLNRMWKFLNKHIGLKYESFVKMSETERDELFLSVIATGDLENE